MEKKGLVLVVDDDAQMRALVTEFLTDEGYEVRSFGAAPAILELLKGELDPGRVDLVISDINMPLMTGTELATRMKTDYPDIPVILITAFGSIESAIGAMRLGAYDYVVKPFRLAEIAVTVERAIEFRRLHAQNALLRNEIQKSWSLCDMIGKSPAIQSVFDLVRRVSNATANVLITGESGTGKEMVARALHELGPRKGKPFVAINCAAIPETLLESELFGHAKGSFTGATQRKAGLIEEAHGGTLFLDEIGDMDLALQAKLLRVLQERKVRPVGETVAHDIDVRVITATHRNLKKMIQEGSFREDLFYRLSVIPIALPSLRERREDIPLLAQHFLRKFAAANGKNVRGFTSDALAALMKYRWSGNIRELENLVERTVVLCGGPEISASDLPELETTTPDEFFREATASLPTIDELEKKYIELVLQKTGGRKDKAAKILGINRRTLYRKEHEYGFVTRPGTLATGPASPTIM